MLVKAGSDVHAEDNRHCSCLLAAVRRGHVDVVSWLCGDYRLSSCKPQALVSDALSRVVPVPPPAQLEKDGVGAAFKTNSSSVSASVPSASAGSHSVPPSAVGGGGGKKGRVARKPANGWTGVVRQFPNDAELERVRSQVPLEPSALPANVPAALKSSASAKPVAAGANATAAAAANKGSATPAAVNMKKPVGQPAPQSFAPGTVYSGPHAKVNPGKQTTVAPQNASQNANFNNKGLRASSTAHFVEYNTVQCISAYTYYVFYTSIFTSYSTYLD